MTRRITLALLALALVLSLPLSLRIPFVAGMLGGIQERRSELAVVAEPIPDLATLLDYPNAAHIQDLEGAERTSAIASMLAREEVSDLRRELQAKGLVLLPDKAEAMRALLVESAGQLNLTIVVFAAVASTPTVTPTATASPTPTGSPPATATPTGTATATATATATSTGTATATATVSPTGTPTATATPSPTVTATPSETPTTGPSPTPTATRTPAPYGLSLPLVLKNGTTAAGGALAREGDSQGGSDEPLAAVEELSAYLVAIVASDGTAFFQAHHTNLDPRLAEAPDPPIVVNAMPYFYVTTLRWANGRIVPWRYWWYDSNRHPNWYYAFYKHYRGYYLRLDIPWPGWYHWAYGWYYWRFWYYWSTYFPYDVPLAQ